MKEVIYNGDTRYPGPSAHPPPEDIKGIPTQDELNAYPRMFTWGELKGIIKTNELELLMRNKAMQHRYDKWMSGIKVKYGSTEKYLTQARLPWTSNTTPEPTYDLSTSPTSSSIDKSAPPPPSIPNLTSSTNPELSLPVDIASTSNVATPGGRSNYGSISGTSTPSSAGFVSLASLKLFNGKLRSRSGRVTPKGVVTGGNTPISRNSPPFQSPPRDEQQAQAQAQEGDEGENGGEAEEEEPPVYLRFDKQKGLDKEKYAVLPNDWPYNVPYGVRHFCVWSRVPIAHPELVDYSPEAWGEIELNGLCGFTGITPLREFHLPSPPSEGDLNPSQQISSRDIAGRVKFIGELPDRDWYAADVAYAGKEMLEWAGVEYTSVGGQEVGRMVEGLWDPRGWECIWFVNPPRLQSVPGFSHFHVFARRKTPEEIDAGEAFYGSN